MNPIPGTRLALDQALTTFACATIPRGDLEMINGSFYN
jgi:hypothetical protein